MSDFRYAQTSSATRSSAQVDQGLRSYMLGVYNYMTIGLAITGLTAIGTNMLAVTTSNGVMQLTDFGATIYRGPLHWVVMLAPLGLILAMGAVKSNNTLRMLFFALSALIGVSMSVIMMRYAGTSIARTFFITAASFGALSLYGYTTKRSLTGMGSFLMMGLFGIIIASIVNIFMASSAVQFAISVIGVLLFAGFTAYDTQAIKSTYLENDGYGGALNERNAIHGAVQLYLDFVNMFQFLLSIMGDRR